MAKFILWNFLYLILHFATLTVARKDPYTPPPEKLIYEPSPTPEGIETFYNKSKAPLDPQLSLYMQTTNVSFDEAQLICNLELYINLKWVDTRLPNALKYLGIPEDINSTSKRIPFYKQKIWAPTLEFRSRFTWEDIEFPDNNKSLDAYVNLYPQSLAGHVSILTSWHGTVQSENDFRYFPGDNHFCRFHFHIMAGEFGDERLVLKASIFDYSWGYGYIKPNTVFSRSDARMKISEDNEQYFTVDILFTRKIGYYLIQTFVPSALVTGVSLISLFLPAVAAEARVYLCVGILIALTVFSNEARKVGPILTYITAMDIWLLGCISMEILTLIENIIILKITTRRVIPTASTVMSVLARVMRLTPGYSPRQSDENQVTFLREIEEQEQKDVKMRIQLASKIDYICMIIIVGLVLACNIAYWLTLHFHKNYMVNSLKFGYEL